MDKSQKGLLAELYNKTLPKIHFEPEWAIPQIDIDQLITEVSDLPNSEDTIIGDIKREIKEQNKLSYQQIELLVQQYSLLADNYNKLKEVYETQIESYKSTKEDLIRSRRYNIWMMVIAIIAMLAAVISPIVTVLVS